MSFSENKKKIRLFGEIFKTLGWAIGVLKDYKTRLYLYIICLVLQSVYQIYMTSKIGNVVDLALENDSERLVRSGIFFVILYAMNVIITIACNRFASHNYNGMYNELEMKVYRKIMDASWDGLTDYHSGDLLTRLSSDINTVAGNTSGLVPTMVSKLALILGAGLFIVYLDYSMIILALIIAPIVLVASRIFMGKIYRSEKELREIESKINSYNVETFNNIQAVKAFGIGDFFYNRMNDVEIHRRKVDLKTNKYIMCSYGTSYFAGIIGACVLIVWMFHRIHQGYISYGALSVIAFLALQIGQATEALLDLVPTIMAYMASADRVKMLLDIPDEKDGSSKAATEFFESRADTVGLSVHVRDMYFKYKNGHIVFESAELDAFPGEIVALVGPSGEGKTTMLRILLGIVVADRGRVYMSNGKDELDMGASTRSVISYVPQGNTMMSGTILENMRLVRQEAEIDEINEALKAASIFDFIEKLPEGLEYKLGQGGQGL